MFALRVGIILTIVLMAYSDAHAFSWPWKSSYYKTSPLTESIYINHQWKIVVHRFEKAPGNRYYDLRKISCIEIRPNDPDSIIDLIFINPRVNTIMVTTRNASTDLRHNFEQRKLGTISMTPGHPTEVNFHCTGYNSVPFLEFFKHYMPAEVYSKLMTLLASVSK